MKDEFIINGNAFQVLKKFSKSTQSDCYLVKNNNVLQVLKLYYNCPHVKPNLAITKIRKNIKHNNILDVLEFGYHNNRFYELTEYCPGETLLEKMPVTQFEDIKSIIYQINEALNYCHSNGFMFFDIKPFNIFLKDNSINGLVFGDFGNASFFTIDGDHLIDNYTKAFYSPPEAHYKFHDLNLLDKSFDYYTLGIMLIELFTGHNKLQEIAFYDRELLLKIKEQEKVDLSGVTDSRLKTLIKNLIKAKKSQRWFYDDVKQWCYNPLYDFEKQIVTPEPSYFKQLKDEVINRKRKEINNVESNFTNQIHASNDQRQKQLLSIEKNSKINKIEQEILSIQEVHQMI